VNLFYLKSYLATMTGIVFIESWSIRNLGILYKTLMVIL